MFPRNIFSQHKATVSLDGREVPTASMATKGVAVAVDLTLTVGVASWLLYLLSRQVPLDSDGARIPMAIGVAVVFAVLVFGRDHLFSPGRQILRLALVRLPGNVPGLYGRKMSVHRDELGHTSSEALTKAILVVVLSTALSMFSLAASLTTTRMFSTVVAYVDGGSAISGAAGVKLALKTLPRALLIGQHRGYVQIDAQGPAGTTTVEFFLRRDHRQWRVEAAREIVASMTANYSLGTSDNDIPAFADN